MARKGRKENPLIPFVEIAPPKRIYHVGEYSRLSVEDSGKGTSDSIENQQAMIRDYVAAQPDMEHYAAYCDNGETGVNFERPAFERLMEDVKNGKVDCIVVKDLSRFGRNYIETGNYLERVFPFLGVRFIAITDGFDSLTAERSEDGYIIPLKNLINHIYAKDISKKSGSALAAKQKNGEFIGAWAAYGYHKDPDNKNAILVDDEVAPIVRDIFHWYSDGVGIPMIARKLTELGIPSPSAYRFSKGIIKNTKLAAAPWRVQVIKNMLQSEVYIGNLVQGRKRESLFEGKKQKMLPKEEWIIVQNTHEAIIEKALFDRVQRRLEEAHARYNNKLGVFAEAIETENLLKGLIYCGDCGTLLTRYKKVRINKVKEPKYHIWYSYICPLHVAYLDRCSFISIPETEVLQAVFSTLRMQIACAAEIQNILIELQKQPTFRYQKTKRQAEKLKLEQKLSEVTKYRKGLFENYYAKVISEKEYLYLTQSYEKEVEQISARLAELNVLNEVCQEQHGPSSRWITALMQFSEAETLTREMVLALVERIVVTQNREITITLKYRDEYRAVCEYLSGQAVGACV